MSNNRLDPYSILEDNHCNLGKISFESISWNEFRVWCQRKPCLVY